MEIPGIAATLCVQTAAYHAIGAIQATYHLKGFGGGWSGSVIIAQGLLLLDELWSSAQRIPSTCRGGG